MHCHINIQALKYDRINIFEGNDVNKPMESRKCILCNYYYFLKVNFRFQPKACDGCHDLIQDVISFDYAAIASVKGSAYRIYNGI